MPIFLKSFLSVILVSIFLSLFFFNSTLAVSKNYSLDVFAQKAGYETTGTKASLEDTVQLVINSVLSLTGIIFLLLAVYAGIRWMTAQGNTEHVTKAQETLQAAIIGMVIISVSWAVTTVIFNTLQSGVPTNNTSGGSAESENAIKCMADSDCLTGEKCDALGQCFVFVPPVCSDIGYDCGGGCAKKCEIGQTCGNDNDCTSVNCVNQICAAVVNCSFLTKEECVLKDSCALNADDLCGPAPTLALCDSDAQCDPWEICSSDKKCYSKKCTDDTNHCGGDCPKCPVEPLNHFQCGQNSDCLSGYCEANTNLCTTAPFGGDKLKCIDTSNFWIGLDFAGKCISQANKTKCDNMVEECNKANQIKLDAMLVENKFCKNTISEIEVACSGVCKSTSDNGIKNCADVFSTDLSSAKALCVATPGATSANCNNVCVTPKTCDANCLSQVASCKSNCVKGECEGKAFTDSKKKQSSCEDSINVSQVNCDEKCVNDASTGNKACNVDFPVSLDACVANKVIPCDSTCAAKTEACLGSEPALVLP